MKRKFLAIITIMFLVIFAFGVNVFAKETITNANITLKSDKTQYEIGEMAQFVIHLSNLESTKGIITFGANIEYDSSILKLIKISGAEDWSSNDNSSNIIGIYRASNSANAEDIATIKFEVLKPSKTTSLNIKLNNIDMSNGGGFKIASVSSNTITVNVPETVTPPDNHNNTVTPPSQEDPGNDEGTGNNNQTTTPPSSSEDNNNHDNSQNDGNQDENNNQTTPPSQGNNSSNENNNDNNNNGGNSGNNEQSSSNGQSNSREPSQNENNPEGNNPEENSSNPHFEITGGTSNKKNNGNNTSDGKIPQLGTNYIFEVVFILAVVIAIICFTRVKLLNKRIRKNLKEIADDIKKRRLQRDDKDIYKQ